MIHSFAKITIAPVQLRPSSFGRKKRWLLLLLLLPMLACGLPSLAPVTPFHATGQIVFECWPEGISAQTCIVNADGSEKRVITPTSIPIPDSISGYSPTWSPNKKKLAFLNIEDKNFYDVSSLFVADQDGRNKTRLMKGVISKPVWSPSGSKIAYIYYDLAYSDDRFLYIINSDGSDQTKLAKTNVQLASQPWAFELASWSPDETKLIFHCVKKGICSVNVDGSNLIQLSDSGMSPTWSPDGQYIAYYQSDQACIFCTISSQLWVMRSDGSQPTKITDGPLDQHPVWMPLP